MPRRLASTLVLVVCIALTAPAEAAYDRVANVPPDDDIGVAGDAVVFGTTPRGGTSVLAAYARDGVAHPIELPAPASYVEELMTSGSALAALTIPARGGGTHGYYGPVSGPLRRVPGRVIDVAASGDLAVSLLRRSRDRGLLDVRNVRTGTARRLAIPGHSVAVVTAAGRHAAYMIRFATPREIAVVVDVATGRERYRARVPEGSTYGLAPDGRLWFFQRDRRSGRVLTATRRDPTPRPVTRLLMNPYEFAVTRHGVALVQDLGHPTGRVVLLRPDGERRAVTPALPAIDAVAWDGRTLAFSTGSCVFAGAVPAAAPEPLALDGCEPPPP